MKVLSALLVVLGVAALQPPRPQRGASRGELRQLAQPAGAEPIEVLNAEKAWAGAEPLLRLAVPLDNDPSVRAAAVRALGRLEDPRVVPQLLALRGSIGNGVRADALAQALHGFDPAIDPALVRAATAWMFGVAAPSIASPQTLEAVAPMVEPLSRIAHPTPDEVHRAETILLKVANFTAPDPRQRGFYVAAARAFESLARINQRVTPLDDETAERLKKMVRGMSSNDVDDVRLYAFMALNAGRSLDADTERAALKDGYWQLRRVAAAVLAGAGAGLDDEARADAIQDLLDDRAPQVRYEALRAYARRSAATRGCGPLEDLLGDSDAHVVVAAIDALGDLCRSDEDLTTRLAAEARVPPAIGSWHRETHAFVALAKRSPERAVPSMGAFVTHPVWWVRMYAAGAAAAAGDLVHLEKLAYDSNDNVREAALGPWRRLKKAEADPAILDALGRSDIQLLRTAAMLLKDSPRSDRVWRALMDALMRLTKEGKETSRDARLPILEAIAIHASPDNAVELAPFLKDFDPKVAEKAAQVMIGLSGKVALPEPAPYSRGWPQAFKDLRQCVSVQLAGGGSFRMRMDPRAAPVAVDRFLKLAVSDHYYDGLSIHRVVPNFVVQGGSPGANEYSGAREFMRDEIAARNARGTVGLSTRGRNTGDGQFFINMVDNPRLNGDYTIFASVPDADLAVVDRIQEGDVMTAVNLTKCGSDR
jgi:cyclophilin family peptidyl-prolyl cis-trans isomerase